MRVEDLPVNRLGVEAGDWPVGVGPAPSLAGLNQVAQVEEREWEHAEFLSLEEQSEQGGGWFTD